MRGCAIEGCDRVHKARGYCNRHYVRWRTHGDPTHEPATVPSAPLVAAVRDRAAVRGQTVAELLGGRSQVARLWKWERRGHIDLFEADTVCVRILGRTIDEIYGDAV
jgi:hypothetical protein